MTSTPPSSSTTSYHVVRKTSLPWLLIPKEEVVLERILRILIEEHTE